MYVKVDVCKMVVDTCESCFVCDDGGGRRREAGGGGRREAPGIQNQKQEPHTKLWGKTQ